MEMKVLAIIAHPEYGGTETHVLSLARMFRRHKIHMGLATYGGPFVHVVRQQGVSIHNLSKSGGFASPVHQISQIVKQHGYTVIHAHDIESFRMLPHLCKRLPQVPRLMTVHGIDYSRNELRQAAMAANMVIAVSPAVRQRIVQSCRSAKKVKLIPNGIDTNRFSPSTDSATYRRALGLPVKSHICLYAGRFQSDKWHVARKVIIASERIAKRHKNFVAVLIGFGAYRSRLSRLAKQVNRRLGRAVVHVLPPTTRIQDYYRAADLVVGTGRVALEAMSCGKPVIAAGISGYEGIVDPKSWRKAVTHQFGDHAASNTTTVLRLSNDIHKLLVDRQHARSSGNFGRKMVVRQFSLWQAAKETIQTYNTASRHSPR